MGLRREGSTEPIGLSKVELDRGFDPMQPTDPATDRLVRIESTLMHLSHDVEAMHQAIVAQQREIDAVRRSLERLQAAWDREEESSPETRDPAAEKPPHY
jgi:uncharacterized coiled-coil protein SlyX